MTALATAAVSLLRETMPDVATPALTAPLIGRESEIGALRDAWAQADDGEAAAVVLAGDAGIGKTRLVTEISAEVQAQGGVVLLGHCLGLGQAAPPFLPILEIISQLHAATEDTEIVESTERLLRADVAGDQVRLFDGVLALLVRAARSAPVLVVIEDLHWSDPSTRDLLLFLLSRLGSSRILVLLTYRSDDLNRQHPLRPWLASVARMRGVRRVDVEPWGPEAARAFARALLPEGQADDELVADVATRSEGNAFFAEELMSAASGGAAELSDVLTSVLLDRIERLSSAAQRVVRAAAIVGQRDLWASSLEGLVATDVVGLAPAEIESALRECVQSHVLVVAHDGAYAFRHALLREALLADMLPGESARLHGAYVAVLEAEQPSGWQAAIAFHATRAGDLPRALRARLEASAVAGEFAAHSDALAHVEKALALWPAVTDPEAVTGVDELTLLLRACDEATAAARTDRALSYARAAVEMATATGAVLQQAGARRRIAKLLYNSGEWREAERQIALAWALLENEPSTAERAWVMSTMSYGEITPERRDLAERAIAEARAVGAQGAEADALISLAFLLQHEGDVDGAMERLQEARRKAREGGADDTELRAFFNMAILRYDHDRIPEAVEIAQEGIAVAARHGRSWSGYGRELTWLLCLVDIARGAFTEVMTRTTAALEAVPAGERELVLSTRVLAASWLGDWKLLDADVAALGTAEQIAGAVLTGRVSEAMAGHGIVNSWLWRGRPDLVEQALTAALARPEYPDDLAEIRIGAALLAARADALGHGAPRSHDPGWSTEEILQRVERVAQVGVPRGNQLGAEGRMWLARARAEAARARGENDPGLWRAVVEVAEYGERPHEALARWRLGEALLTAGDRTGGDELIRAHALATEMAAAPLSAAVEAACRRFKITLPGRRRIGTDLLTPRERSVLERVARGLTNRAVGAELFISEKTVSVHLTRVMAKLGATSRTEAVALAMSRGLI
jgi:DNA-binding CsgD family transcriptional regulator/tetratricopeptide (TPR) repeat protein